ncbi:hypothetical protein V6N13_104636 [Hibiscus sabdariffa]|uniref:Uncharacterized protein n=2 Tax=Hibiscus sabdariffa TaxID=183260 RepID=A0ABR2P9S1_9ROSI
MKNSEFPGNPTLQQHVPYRRPPDDTTMGLNLVTLDGSVLDRTHTGLRNKESMEVDHIAYPSIAATSPNVINKDPTDGNSTKDNKGVPTMAATPLMTMLKLSFHDMCWDRRHTSMRSGKIK